MKSMTGYGEAAAQGSWVKVVVQLRALNHRHLDIQMRVPRECLSLEEEIRNHIRQRISRGRVEVFINRSLLRGRTRTLELDEDLLGQYIKSLQQAKRKFGLRGDIDLFLFSNFPELFRIEEFEVREEDEKGLVLRCLTTALKNLERSRQREGRQLKLDVDSQVRHLKRIASGLTREAKQVQLRLRDFRRIKEKDAAVESAGSLADVGNAFFKGDIHEEVVRLKTHVAALSSLMAERGPVGKKLDFLLQEIQRELNTISSKAPQLPVVHLVLAGKERVEKIREQAQNLE